MHRPPSVRGKGHTPFLLLRKRHIPPSPAYRFKVSSLPLPLPSPASQIGGDRIALDDVVGISRFSYTYCVGMALKLLVGTLPWASVLLFTSLVHLYFPVFRRLRYVTAKTRPGQMITE